MPGQVDCLDPLVGKEVSHYRINEKIGRGGMGVVYRGYHQHLDREVALELLLPGTSPTKRVRRHFRREALTLRDSTIPTSRRSTISTLRKDKTSWWWNTLPESRSTKNLPMPASAGSVQKPFTSLPCGDP